VTAVTRDEQYLINKQMDLLQVSNEQLNSIYEAICKIQELQKQHAELIREMASLLGFESEEKTPGRIIT